MLTILEVLKRTTEFLSAHGVESPRLNAELLIGQGLGRKRMQLYLEFERPLTEMELAGIRPLVRRRARHEPLQYIMGETEFCGVQLKVDPRALIPRPETELLVEHTLGWCAAHPPVSRILDLGTGTGAIALALARAQPEVAVVAVDRSDGALALARENAGRLGLTERVTLQLSDWYSAVPAGPYDVIVANPPYLSAEETAAAPSEVREFEPREALTSPADGCSDLERIIQGAPGFLRAGGLLALETGVAHHARLAPVLNAAGFSHVDRRQDLAGRDRFILAVF